MDRFAQGVLRLANLAEVVVDLPRDRDWLTQEERARFDAMRSERRRHQFLAGHWRLRCLASERMPSAPDEWLWAPDAQGRPALRHRRSEELRLHASLSHSGDWIACAVSEQPIGIDIECDSRPRDLERLAGEVFPAEQWRPLDGLSEAERRRGFYEQWTLREAVGKRDGRGLLPAVARSQLFELTPLAEAGVIAWRSHDFSLALAVENASEADISGLPDGTSSRGWRLVGV